MLEISIKSSEDIEAVRESAFQKSSFICKKKPRTKVLVDRILGTITQSRKKYWVVAKPGRQVGDRPKVDKRFKLDPELVDFIEALAKTRRCYQVDIVEAALKEYRQNIGDAIAEML